MSSFAAELESPPDWPTTTAWLAKPRVLSGVALAGAFAAAGGGLLLATSDHLVNPVTYGLELAVIVAGTVGVAVCWVVRRPNNRIAPVLLAYATAIACVSLQGAANPVLHSLGVLAEAP